MYGNDRPERYYCIIRLLHELLVHAVLSSARRGVDMLYGVHTRVCSRKEGCWCCGKRRIHHSVYNQRSLKAALLAAFSL